MSLKSRKMIAMVGATLLLALPLTACSSPEPVETEKAVEPQIAPPAILNAGKLKVCWHTSAPFSLVNTDGEPEGASIDMVYAWGEQLGLDVELSEYQFAGLIPALQAQQCDMLIGPYVTDERKEVANFVEYLVSGAATGVTPENPADITGYDDSMCGKNIGGLAGAVINVGYLETLSAECVANGDPAIEIVLGDTIEAIVQQVINGQIDALFDASTLIEYYGSQTDGDLIQVGDPVTELKIGAGSLKDNVEFHEALQGAMDAIIEDGTYAEILEKWGIPKSSVV